MKEPGFQRDCLLFTLPHRYYDIIFFFSRNIRNDVSFYGLSVYGNGFDAFFHIVWVHDFDMISSFPEFSCELKITETGGYAWINAQSRMRGVYAQNILGNIDESPCGGTGQPAVFGFAVEFGIRAGYHLGVYIKRGCRGR